MSTDNTTEITLELKIKSKIRIIRTEDGYNTHPINTFYLQGLLFKNITEKFKKFGI